MMEIAPAAQIGLPPKVEPWVWSVSVYWQESANIVAAKGNPPPIALAVVTISG